MPQIIVDGIEIAVTRKRVKHLRIVVNRRNRSVRISSPYLVSRRAITRFAESQIEWIRKQLQKAEDLPVEPAPTFEPGETHYLWGMPCALEIIEGKGSQKVTSKGGKLILNIRPGSTAETKEKVLREFYREEIKSKIPGLIKKWEPVMGVRVKDWGVKKMKTRWGTCNTKAGRIWLNLHLAKKDPAFLEYIVVHEMNHLLERLHSKRFYALMDRFMPKWREIDKKLGGKHWGKQGAGFKAQGTGEKSE